MVEHGMDVAQRIIWQWGMPIALVVLASFVLIKLIRRVPRRVLLLALLLIGGAGGGLVLWGISELADPGVTQHDLDELMSIFPLATQEKSAPKQTSPPSPTLPRTNALCGRCGGTFWASWAPICKCSHCGFSMNTRQAMREHGPAYIPFSIR